MLNRWSTLTIFIGLLNAQFIQEAVITADISDSTITVFNDSSSYSGLFADSLLPRTVGPLYFQLPLLTSFSVEKNDTSLTSTQPISLELIPAGNLSSSGTFFRSLELNANGSSQFSGGLRFQLTGDLGSDIRVSGILADETLPIQPDGTTASLDEIDRVFLQIDHPYGQVFTGDVLLKAGSGKFYQYQRNMVGIKSNFIFGSWSGTAGLGGSKGIFRTLEMKGQEGNQGPYFLTSNDGNRNITIAAGSEKVWLDGKLLSRGESYDYSIDYSTGELFFTPEHLIHFDSDIHVEYQYLDSGYRQDLIESSLTGELGTGGQFQVAYFSEKDRTGSRIAQLPERERKLLQQAGDSVVEDQGAVADSTGDYILTAGIYVYDPLQSDFQAPRYAVNFMYDGAGGSYKRQISGTGAIYYEFIPESERSQYLDLYSPSRRLKAPVAQKLVHFQGDLPVSDNLRLSTELAYSINDENTLSPLQDSDNRGYAQRFNLSASRINLGERLSFDYDIEYWQEGSRFLPLQWDRSVTFNSDWDISGDQGGKESVSAVKSNLYIGENIQNNVQFSQFRSTNGNKKRISDNFAYSGKYINNLKLFFSTIQSDSKYQKGMVSVVLLPGYFHPYFSWDHEIAQDRYKYDRLSVGYQFKKQRLQTSLGVGQRNDWLTKREYSRAFQPSSKGYFGEFNYQLRTAGGWNQKVTMRKRILTDYSVGKTSDFDNYRINLNYQQRTSPLRYDLMLLNETSLTESRAIVYDSVGTGLGYYRYDPQFNDYIQDPGGAYVARTIFTGDRKSENRASLTQRLGIDLGRLPLTGLNNLSYRLDMQAEYRGSDKGNGIFHNSALGAPDVTRSRYYLRNELDYNLAPFRRWKGWTLLNRDLNGFDPRGQEYRKRMEQGLYFQETVTANVKLIGSMDHHSLENKSELSDLRKRQFTGTNIEGGLMLYPDPAFKGSIVFVNRRDSGTARDGNDFNAYSNGIKTDFIWFSGKKGRLEALFEFHQALGDKFSTPPEALKGLAPGKTVRLNLEGSYLVGDVLSVIVNLMYQDDNRFNHFITVSGELRAQF
ncbi:MAG: hypothetical protein ACE5D2_04250 [Fidelibacterota bacterium]